MLYKKNVISGQQLRINNRLRENPMQSLINCFYEARSIWRKHRSFLFNTLFSHLLKKDKTIFGALRALNGIHSESDFSCCSFDY